MTLEELADNRKLHQLVPTYPSRTPTQPRRRPTGARDQGHRAQGTRGRPRRPCRAAAALPPRPSAPLRRQELDLSGNKLMVLDGLEQFSTLKVLRAARNQITEVTIEKLPRLKILDLSHNKLDGLPDLCPPFRSNRLAAAHHPPPHGRRRCSVAAAARGVRRPARRACAGVAVWLQGAHLADFSHNVSRRSLTIRSRMRGTSAAAGADSQPPRPAAFNLSACVRR